MLEEFSFKPDLAPSVYSFYQSLTGSLIEKKLSNKITEEFLRSGSRTYQNSYQTGMKSLQKY